MMQDEFSKKLEAIVLLLYGVGRVDNSKPPRHKQL
jgi:hypothetical protein